MLSLWVVFLAVLAFYWLSSGFRKRSASANANRQNATKDAALKLIALVAKVAKSDGVVSSQEAELISNIISDFSARYGISRQSLKDCYEAEKSRLDNARNIAMEYRFSTGASASDAVGVLVFLLNLAYIDGSFSPAEQKIISDIASGLGISQADKSAIFTRFEAEFNSYFNTQASSSPYEVLGLENGAEFSEVKKRYRELVKQNHPDILMGQNAKESVIQEATKRLQEINQAYEEIKKQQGQ